MIHLTKIMHPSDFSDNSKLALYYASEFARQFNATLHIVHVISDPFVSVSPPIAGFLPPGSFKEMEVNSDKTLSEMAAQELLTDNTIVHITLTGNTSHEIVTYAKAKCIDMIVMGTHGYTGLTHMIMGSVAENVVRIAPCPVLTVRPEEFGFAMP